VALEGPNAVSNADQGTEDEGVTAVESGGWLDDDGSRRVRHEIFGEIPYLRASYRCFRPATYQGEYLR
jgi:hypothetical protein